MASRWLAVRPASAGQNGAAPGDLRRAMKSRLLEAGFGDLHAADEPICVRA
jgi:hypothetical protein